MNTRRLLVLAGTALGAVASLSSAQQISWTIDGVAQPPINSGADLTVSLGTVSTTRLVRFWDPTPNPVTLLPNDDLGKIIIQGTLSGNGEVRVLIAPPSVSWPTFSQAILGIGIRNFGIDTNDGIEVTDAALREKTRLAGFVSGDVRGSIVVGQVQRLQVGADPVVPNPGIIYANITAIAPRQSEGETGTRDSIAYISAGNGIRGTIKAEPATTDGTIGTIVVGPSTSAEGIKGDILAETGLIRTIYTTGPIDSGTSTPVRIAAGNAIGEIRTINASTGDLVDADVNATIVSNQVMIDDPETYTYTTPPYDGAFSRMDVGGDLRGSIRVGNLTRSSSIGGSLSRYGIFVDGICYAPINVDLMVDGSTILAKTFLEEIEIGRGLRGAVVAIGGATTPSSPPSGYADGKIESITVGFQPLDPDATLYTDLPVGLSSVIAGWDRTLPTPPEE